MELQLLRENGNDTSDSHASKTFRGRRCRASTRFAIESVAANAVSPFKGGPALIITYYYSFAPLCAATMAENRGLASFSPRVSAVYRLSGYGFRVT